MEVEGGPERVAVTELEVCVEEDVVGEEEGLVGPALVDVPGDVVGPLVVVVDLEDDEGGTLVLDERPVLLVDDGPGVLEVGVVVVDVGGGGVLLGSVVVVLLSGGGVVTERLVVVEDSGGGVVVWDVVVVPLS